MANFELSNPAPTSLDEAVLAAEYSQTKVEFRGVVCTPSGYFYQGKARISLAKAEALTAEPAPAPEPAEDLTVDHRPRVRTAPQTGLDTEEPAPKRQPKRTGFAFENLNQATQDLFLRLAEVLANADQIGGARLGVDVHVPLTDAPRLTNIKKARLLETISGEVKSHRYLKLTEEGRRVWQATVGA